MENKIKINDEKLPIKITPDGVSQSIDKAELEEKKDESLVLIVFEYECTHCYLGDINAVQLDTLEKELTDIENKIYIHFADINGFFVNKENKHELMPVLREYYLS